MVAEEGARERLGEEEGTDVTFPVQQGAGEGVQQGAGEGVLLPGSCCDIHAY